MSHLLSPLSIAVFAALAVLSLAMVTVAIRKFVQFRQMGVGKGPQAEAALDMWLGGRVNEAVKSARAQKTVLGRILAGVISGLQARPGDTAFAEELGRQTALVELARMGRFMRFLDICVQSAPMLGLLGTVLGMIDAFATLSATQGMADPASLAGGIWTALTTTAAGLALSLVASFITSWFEARIEQERISAEALISAAIYGRVDPAHKG